jgi:hypothetical protein
VYIHRPCDLILEEEGVKLGFPNSTVEDHEIDYRGEPTSKCTWESRIYDDYSRYLKIEVIPDDRLDTIYYEADNPLADIYTDVKLDVVGQPAVAFRYHENIHECNIVVGMSDQQSIELQAYASDSERVCEQVIALAEIVVRRLGG